MDPATLLLCIEGWDAARDLVTPFCTHQAQFRLVAIRTALQTTVWAEQLFEAALAEEREITHLQALLQLGTHVKTKQLFHRIFHRCAQQPELLAQLWQSYPNYHQAQLHSCVKYGKPKQLIELISLGACLDELHESDLPHLCQRLEESGGQLREVLWEQLTPLQSQLKQIAWDQQNLSLICWLGEDNVETIDCGLLHDVLSAAAHLKAGQELDCLRLFEACDLDKSPGHSRDLLVVDAVRAGQSEILRGLKQAGFSMDAYPPGGDSPVATAVKLGDSPMLELLLRLGASPDPASGELVPLQAQLTPLQEALIQPALTQRKALVDLLLQYGADPNKHHNDTEHPLKLSSDPEIQSLLVDYGAALPIVAEEACCATCC